MYLNSYVRNWAPYFNPEGVLLPNVEVDVTCVICQHNIAITTVKDDTHESWTMLPCGHVFGLECTKKWFSHVPNCPSCRMTMQHPGCLHAYNPKEIAGGPDFNLKSLPPIMNSEAQLPATCGNCPDADPPYLAQFRGIRYSQIQLDRWTAHYGDIQQQLSQARRDLAMNRNISAARDTLQRIVERQPFFGINSHEDNISPPSSPQSRRERRHRVLPPAHPPMQPGNHHMPDRRSPPDQSSRARPYGMNNPRVNELANSERQGVRPYDPFAARPHNRRCPRGTNNYENQLVQRMEAMQVQEESPRPTPRVPAHTAAAARWNAWAAVSTLSF